MITSVQQVVVIVAEVAETATSPLSENPAMLPTGRHFAIRPSPLPLKLPLGARAATVDVSSETSVSAWFDSVDNHEGRVDLLINYVGNYDPKPVAELTPDLIA